MMGVLCFHRPKPLGRLRIWTDGDSPINHALPEGTLVVEWAGRTGHPTSYALLGAKPAIAGVKVSLPATTLAFPDSLAGVADKVAFNGFFEEYIPAIVEGLAADTERGWDVLVAAAGEPGSSINAFRWASGFLIQMHRILDSGTTPSDESVWAAWDLARPL